MSSKSDNSFRAAARTKLREQGLGDKVHKATLYTVHQRNLLVDSMPEWESLCERAREARLRALDRHDALLESFLRAMKARGVNVSLASGPDEACKRIASLAMEAGGRVTKGKSMASEEVGLNQALERAGAQVTETDLGELIVQLAGQRPSHVTAPAIHFSTEDIARIFRDKLDMQVPPWIDDDELADPDSRKRLARELSLKAREHLRQCFLQADVGITGANFLVAETGTVVLLENEGNIMLTTALPKRHIVLAGIDKLVETEKDLGVLLRVLPVSATAQRQSCYVSFLADTHPDMHVVLLDNGRSKLMRDKDMRDLLTCIRCGACMNACPVYRNVGGHAYGGAYPGPIGALLIPQLNSSEAYQDLPFASSLCGACTEICPVKIPLHRHLLTMRARVSERIESRLLSWPLRWAASAMKSGTRMDRSVQLLPIARKAASLHPAGKAWLDTRDWPKPPKETFRSWWRRERQERQERQDQSAAKGEPQLKPKVIKALEETCPVQPSHDALLKMFEQRLSELGPECTTELHVFEQASVAEEFLRIRCEQYAPDSVAVVYDKGAQFEKKEYELGITYAETLIAETGGIVIDMGCRSAGRPVMLADTHIVVGKPSQLVPTVAHAVVTRSVRRKSGVWGDYQVIVTGPSRTADVEKVLVIPAHGPRRLVVVLCEETVDLLELGLSVGSSGAS